MRHHKEVAATVAAVAVLAATASSASAYPSSVTNRYTVSTTYGNCVIDVTARADAGLVALGSLTGYESVNCNSMTVTPYRIYLSGGFSNTSADRLDLLHSGEPNRICEWQKSCSWSRSGGLFPVGDHSVRHDVTIDIAPYAVSQTYLSYPGQCKVAASDRGYLGCSFWQSVTMPAPSAPAP